MQKVYELVYYLEIKFGDTRFPMVPKGLRESSFDMWGGGVDMAALRPDIFDMAPLDRWRGQLFRHAPPQAERRNISTWPPLIRVDFNFPKPLNFALKQKIVLKYSIFNVFHHFCKWKRCIICNKNPFCCKTGKKTVF